MYLKSYEIRFLIFLSSVVDRVTRLEDGGYGLRFPVRASDFCLLRTKMYIQMLDPTSPLFKEKRSSFSWG